MACRRRKGRQRGTRLDSSPSQNMFWLPSRLLEHGDDGSGKPIPDDASYERVRELLAAPRHVPEHDPGLLALVFHLTPIEDCATPSNPQPSKSCSAESRQQRTFRRDLLVQIYDGAHMHGLPSRPRLPRKAIRVARLTRARLAQPLKEEHQGNTQDTSSNTA